MQTIQCPSIEKPNKEFSCEVIRPASQMRYQEFTGEWKPVYPESVEKWTILAESLEGAKKIATYHFYSSKILTVK